MHAQLETPMVPSFNVGAIRCRPLIDGDFTYPADWFFHNIAEAREELRNRGASADEITTPYSCLLVEAGTKRILIDTGAGPLAPTTGHLQARLKEHGLTPTDIDVVVLTHGHPDHIGGAVGEDGKPTFPNASYVMAGREWQFWTSEGINLSHMDVPAEIKDLLVSTANRALPPLRSNLELLDCATEIAPGVQCIPAPGHTPGHLAVIITSDRDQLLYAADAVLHPLHIEHPQWQSVFDLDPAQSANTRRKLLDRATAENMLLMAYHFAIPRSGKVRRTAERWEWIAVDEGDHTDIIAH